MPHRQDEVLVYQELTAGNHSFRLEEYWEEDDAGFCCVDYVLAKHTRLTVIGRDGAQVKTFHLDSLEYDKRMELQGDILAVTYHPECDVEKTVRIRVTDLTILGD